MVGVPRIELGSRANQALPAYKAVALTTELHPRVITSSVITRVFGDADGDLTCA